MKVNFKRPIIKRIRKPNTSIYKILRLNRAEYGHDFQSKKNSDIDQYGYYPDVTELINNLKKYLNLSPKNFLVGLGAEGIIKDLLFFLVIEKKE